MEQVNENVMRKLGKIKAHMESAKQIGSEAEAQAFATMLNQMLLKHNMDMSEIQWEAEIKDEPVDMYPIGGNITWVDGKCVLADYPDIEIKSKRTKWAEELAETIASAHACRVLVATHGSSRLWFAGRKSNVAIAEYMFIVMYRTIESLSWKEYKTFRNKVKWAQRSAAFIDMSETYGYRDSWIDGFITRLNHLFYLERQKMETPGDGSTALMRIDKDKQAVAKYTEERGGKPGFQLLWDFWQGGFGLTAKIGVSKRGVNGGGETKQLA